MQNPKNTRTPWSRVRGVTLAVAVVVVAAGAVACSTVAGSGPVTTEPPEPATVTAVGFLVDLPADAELSGGATAGWEGDINDGQFRLLVVGVDADSPEAAVDQFAAADGDEARTDVRVTEETVATTPLVLGRWIDDAGAQTFTVAAARDDTADRQVLVVRVKYPPALTDLYEPYVQQIVTSIRPVN